MNSAPRRAGYEAPFVRALYPMRLEQPGTARINPEEKSATSEPNTRTSDDRERVIGKELAAKFVARERIAVEMYHEPGGTLENRT